MSANKTIVLITGANQGIGFDTATAIARASADYHVILGARSLEKGNKALSDLQSRSLPGSLSLVQLDVTSPDSIAAAAEAVTRDHGRLDVLINNAGIVSFSKPMETEYKETFTTNAIGPALVTDAFTDLLKKSADPRLLYVTSGLGSLAMRADPNDAYAKLPATAYRMSKAALNMLAVCNKAEFGAWGCKVWTYCPGYVVTNLTGEADRERRVETGAGSSETSAEGLLQIVQGKRDADEGKFVHIDGQYPW